MNDFLTRACDDVLIDTMHAGLKSAIDDALAKGASAAIILAQVRSLTGGPRSPRGAMVYLAVEAYLERTAALQRPGGGAE